MVRLSLACLSMVPAALASNAVDAQTSEYPNKQVRVIVAFTAGGTTDILARAVSQKLTEKTKQTFVVDNRPGGGGNIGTEMAARAAPDGYTLIVDSVGPIAVNPTLYKKLNIDPLVDLVLGQRTGADPVHVPYKGADALTDLLTGRVQFMFATIPSVIQHIHAGKLRALAVSSVHRSRSLPDVATVIEQGFSGFEAGSWFGLFGPKGTPQGIITELNKLVNEVLPSLEAQMIREGADPVGGPPAQFGQFVQKEFEKWKIIVQDSKATVD